MNTVTINYLSEAETATGHKLSDQVSALQNTPSGHNL